MRLSEIVDHVILQTGQFVVTDNLEINTDMFWKLTTAVLSWYEKYKPYTIVQTKTVNQYYTYSALVESVPEWISEVIPVNDFSNAIMSTILAGNGTQITPPSVIFNYNKPKLYINYYGKFQITQHHSYSKVEIKNEKNEVIDMDIVELSFDQSFIDLVCARFLIALGNSRKAFILNDLPITTDASDLVNDGKDLLDRTKDSIYDKCKWYYGMGV